MGIRFTRGGRSYTFGSPESEFPNVHVIGAVNWGMAPLHRITQRGPFQDGDTDVDFRLDPRIISLPFVAEATDVNSRYNIRAILLQVFKPGNDVAQLYYSVPADINSRVIDVTVSGGLTMDDDGKDFNVRGVIQLRAANPTWYDLAQSTVYLTATLFGTPTPYPKPYPVTYGAGGVNNIVAINYLGSWATYPRIQCTGPATNLTLVDGVGNIISFDDPIPSLETWTIDLSYGKKTVTNQNGVNQFAALNINSDIVNWGIFPDPTVLNGVNTISVSATDTTTNTLVTLYYNSRYIGV